MKNHAHSLSRSALCLAALLLYSPLAGQELPTPGPEHQNLKKPEGTWSATIKSSEGESKGTMVWTMICGGLWLSSDFESDFGGMPFSGHGLDGYDPKKKKYVSVWVDSMNPAPMMFEGTMDPASRTLPLLGEGPGPDGSTMKFKSVSREVDDNHLHFTMSVVGSDGTETEMMTIVYTRKPQ